MNRVHVLDHHALEDGVDSSVYDTWLHHNIAFAILAKRHSMQLKFVSCHLASAESQQEEL